MSKTTETDTQIANKILGATRFAIEEAMNGQRKLTENETYMLVSAYAVAKQHLSPDYEVAFCGSLLRMLDFDLVEDSQGNAKETYERLVALMLAK